MLPKNQTDSTNTLLQLVFLFKEDMVIDNDEAEDGILLVDI